MIIKKQFGIEAGTQACIWYEALRMWSNSEYYADKLSSFLKKLFPDMADDAELTVTTEIMERIAAVAGEKTNSSGDPFWDFLSGFRDSGESTDLDVGGFTSSNYESERVARTLIDGTAISWIYWSGGGKHGVPEDIDWMREEDGATFVTYEDVSIIQRFYRIPSDSAN